LDLRLVKFKLDELFWARNIYSIKQLGYVEVTEGNTNVVGNVQI